MNLLDNAIHTGEPSIGQMEYLKYLQATGKTQKPSFILKEWTLKKIDISILEQTVSFFTERHESVRTIFPVINDEIKQLVLPSSDHRFQVEYVNSTGNEIDFNRVRKACLEKVTDIFSNIEKGPLIKFLLIRTETGYVFLTIIHHIICDEWSSRIIRQELTGIYEAFASRTEPPLAPITFNLRDYCESQNNWLRQNRESLSTFWAKKLLGFDKPFDITIFRQNYANRAGKSFASSKSQHVFTPSELSAILDSPDTLCYVRIISGAAFQATKRMTASAQCLLSSIVHASLFLLLYAYTGKNKLLVPSLVADRFLPNYQHLIGCLLGSIYFPVHINENKTIIDFIKDVHEEAFMLFTNRQLLFSHEFLGLNGDLIRNCCDMYINYYVNDHNISGGFYATGRHVENGPIHYPIYCRIVAYNDALAIAWNYNKYLFDPEMIEDIAIYYEDLLNYMAGNPNAPIGELSNWPKIATTTLQDIN